MGKRTSALVVAAALGGSVAVATFDAAAPAAPPKDVRLLRFGACSDFLDYMKENAAPSVTASGFLRHVGTEAVGPVPPPVVHRPGDPPIGIPAPPVPAGTIATAPSTVVQRDQPEDDFSATNVQEAGVDEPDIVKSNGSTLFAVAKGKLHSVDVRSDDPRRLDSLALQSGDNHALLLRGKTLLVLSYDESTDVARRLNSSPVVGVPGPPPPPPPPTTTLTEVDVSKPGWMKVVRRLIFQGRYLDARLVRGSARVVFTSSVPNELRFFRPRHYAHPEEALARNRSVIADSKAPNWLPSYEIRNVRTKTKSKRLVQCRHVSRPPRFSGFGMLTVLTIDLDRGLEPVESDSVLGDGDIVYASDESLYVATQPWAGRELVGDRRQPARLETSLHKFDISRSALTAYRASGVVPGYVLNQWALSEHEEILRVASTELPTWWRGASESMVTTFKTEDGRLVALGRVNGLGRGERIFGVRFIGDVGYVVTFRQTDPLYTIDLSRPGAPRPIGELKIPGYSSYLHPLSDSLLLGLGQDATDEGAVLGTQLSIFDVSDLRKPVRLHRRTIEGGISEAEADHHAFLYWGRARLVLVPIDVPDTERAFQGVIGFRIGRQNVEEVGRITHARGKQYSRAPFSPPESIRRTVVVKDALLTVSEAGVRATDLRTFADRGWAAFG